MKIMNIENHGNLKIPVKKYKNHEKLKIQYENHENNLNNKNFNRESLNS